MSAHPIFGDSRAPGHCGSCRAGDHQQHQPQFGGICIGCACSNWKSLGNNQFSGGSAPGAEALAEQADVSERTIRHAKKAHAGDLTIVFALGVVTGLGTALLGVAS